MSRISLQNDNKIKKRKYSSFFDISEALEPQETADDEKADIRDEADKETSKKDRRFKRKTYIAIAVVSVLLVVALILSGIDFFIDGKLDGLFKKDSEPTVYNIYPPDWDTDIYTLQEYLDLDPELIMYGNGTASVEYRPANVYEEKDVAFFYGYFTAIKQGDHEKLNSLFDKAYLEKNGSFKDFPMQKVYNIEIVKHSKTAELDEKYQNSYDYGLYAVKYNIYRNDGLFCAEVDEEHMREEGILVVFNSAGVGTIVERIDAKYLI